jgi:hypothetical protein
MGQDFPIAPGHGPLVQSRHLRNAVRSTHIGMPFGWRAIVSRQNMSDYSEQRSRPYKMLTNERLGSTGEISSS